MFHKEKMYSQEKKNQVQISRHLTKIPYTVLPSGFKRLAIVVVVVVVVLYVHM